MILHTCVPNWWIGSTTAFVMEELLNAAMIVPHKTTIQKN
jgi:hypothetical protein